MRLLLVPFVLLPILELVTLIKVGSVIGAWNAVALVIISAIAGINIIRRQGLHNALITRQKLAAGESPALEMLESLCIAIGGLLMIIPGFLTDTLGILLLIPPLRKIMFKRWLKTFGVTANETNIYEAEYHQEQDWENPQAHIRNTIDGDFTRESDDHNTTKF